MVPAYIIYINIYLYKHLHVLMQTMFVLYNITMFPGVEKRFCSRFTKYISFATNRCYIIWVQNVPYFFDKLIIIIIELM